MEATDQLEVHHLDGDIRNNTAANLATLCPTHHGAAEGKVR